MVSQELLTSWARTQKLLNEARALLSPEVVKEYETSLSDVVEFIEHNELGLAFDWLKSIAKESQWCDVRILEVLSLAAESMKRRDDADVLHHRIFELTQVLIAP